MSTLHLVYFLVILPVNPAATSGLTHLVEHKVIKHQDSPCQTHCCPVLYYYYFFFVQQKGTVLLPESSGHLFHPSAASCPEHGNTVSLGAATEISLDATADAAVLSKLQAILPIQKITKAFIWQKRCFIPDRLWQGFKLSAAAHCSLPRSGDTQLIIAPSHQ